MADLRPELVWIEGRCYRVNDPSTDVGDFREHDLYENDNTGKEMEDIESDEDIEVVKVSDSKFLTSIHVAQHYLGSIIGKQGSTKSRIEHETRTTLKIPKRGESGDILISGPSASNVKRARSKINMIVISSRAKQRDYTHFISIPMNSKEIIDNFNKLKKSILAEFSSDRGLEESLFIREERLHITIGMMSLMDEEERQIAAKLLAETRDTIIVITKIVRLTDNYRRGPFVFRHYAESVTNSLLLQQTKDPLLANNPPLRIRLKGLSYMNDDPSNIHVLYATPHQDNGPPGLLQRLCNEINEYFYKAGFMQKEFDRDYVKLHVTILNTRYRKDEDETDQSETRPGNFRSRNKRQAFDGSNVLEKYLDYDFGVADLNTVHLSVKSTKDLDGYYTSTSVVNCY